MPGVLDTALCDKVCQSRVAGENNRYLI